MTAMEIEKQLAEIILVMQKSCKETLENIDKENATERKTLAMINGIYDMCLNGGLLWNAADRSRMISLKSDRMLALAKKFNYAELVKIIEEAPDGEQERLTAALYGELFMSTVENKYAEELDYARGISNVQMEFEAKTKLAAVKTVINAWKQWRSDNNIYPNMPR